MDRNLSTDNIFPFMKPFLNIPDIMVVLDFGTGKCTAANHAFLNTFGYKIEEVLGETPGDLSLWVNEVQGRQLEEELRREGWISETILPLRNRNGDTHSFRVSASVTVLDGREQLIAILHDVTERLRIEDALKKSRLLLERAEEMANIGSWQFDYSTGVVTGSPGAHRIYGVEEGEMSVSVIESVPLPEYRQMLNEARDNLINRGVPYNIEFKIRRQSDGEILDIHSRAVWDREHRRLFGIIRDITDEKASRKILEALNMDLERQVGETEDFLEIARRAQSRAETVARLNSVVALMAHELNTPLGTALTASSFLSESIDTSLPETPESAAIELICSSIGKAVDLVKEFRRLGVGTAEEERSIGRVELPSFLEILVKTLVVHQGDSAEISIEFQGPPVTVNVDIIAFTEVITELVKNSSLHNSDPVKIEISFVRNGSYLTMTVKDNGVGVDRKIRENVFEPFVTTARGSGRPGLGLSVVHSLVNERLNGTISLLDSEPAGAVFQVRIRC